MPLKTGTRFPDEPDKKSRNSSPDGSIPGVNALPGSGEKAVRIRSIHSLIFDSR
jgi:hypothetical protein